MKRLLGVLVVALLAVPASANASVLRAEDILPPGQSGFVSPTGVSSGTGSPHLNDQTDLFVNFKRKPHTFNQPGETETPRPGVRIVRDRFGVPAITADSTGNMWWGAGYAIAQDRLFQLELFRRATKGKLSEVLGESYLDDDLIARRDYYTADERTRMLDAVPPALRERLTPYRDGINAWIDHVRSNPQDMPGEFAALGVPLQDWTLDDSVAVGIFLARTVPSGSGVELDNLRALRAVGPRAFDRLLPLRTKGQVTTIPRREGVFPSRPRRTKKHERRAFARSVAVSEGWDVPSQDDTNTPRANVAEGMIGRVGGSYMFAVRKKPPQRGAFVFNGPQLGYSIPELFVELEVRSPGFEARGVTAAGVPLVAIGHNGNVAWGYTSGLSDEDDLYAEELTEPGSERYRFKGEDRTMECRDERFEFRSPPTDLLSVLDLELPTARPAGSRTERICRTVHGPVEFSAGRRSYARRYAIWMRELETLEGLTALSEAKTIKDVDNAMQRVTWNENIVAADSNGNIGYWHPGLHPVRPRGYDERLPYPGTGEAEWAGLLSRRRTPHVINPKQGWLMNWNNVPSAGWTSGDAEARERLSGKFHRSAWLRRLVREFSKNPTWEGAENVVFQAGTVAQQHPIALPQLRRAQAGATGKSRAVLDALVAWDGSYHKVGGDGRVDPGVVIWETFKDEAERIAVTRLAGPSAPDTARRVLGDTGSSHAFDITNGEAYALRTLSAADLRLAAEAIAGPLAAKFGTEDVAKWREERKMYEVTAQGAAATPELPFFDRGTWEQIVEVGP